MAITFPRDLIFNNNLYTTFTLNKGLARSTTEQGRQPFLSQIRDPIWSAEFELPTIRKAKQIELLSFLESLSSGATLFTAYDATRCTPLAYQSGGIPDDWDGVGETTAYTNNGFSITNSGSPSGYIYSVGDRISVTQGERMSYHTIVEQSVAGTSGVADLRVEPRVLTGLFTEGAITSVIRARCKYQLTPNSVNYRHRGTPQPITFDAVQVI